MEQYQDRKIYRALQFIHYVSVEQSLQTLGLPSKCNGFSFHILVNGRDLGGGLHTHTLKMYNEVPRTFVPFCTFHLLFYMHLCLKPSDGHGGLRVCIPVQPSDGPGLASQCGQTLAQGPPEFPVLRSGGSKRWKPLR